MGRAWNIQMQANRILVVDDDAMVRESIQLMLEMDGHAIELAGSGPEALERLAAGPYDVVLTDNRMPGMTGLELARRIKDMRPAQLVILFSGSPPVGSCSPCDRVLLKPFSAADLRRVVRQTANPSKDDTSPSN